MKKWKELLWFLIPFVLLSVGTAFGNWYSWVNATPQYIVGLEHYAELLWKDPTFWIAVVNTVLSNWIISGLAALVIGFAVRWLPISRRLKYAVLFGAVTLITAVVWSIGMRLVPQWYNVMFFVQIGNAAAFFAWLAECIWSAVKKPKQEGETQ